MPDKYCSKCSLLKPFDKFYRHNSNSSGLQSRCICCCNEAKKASSRTKLGLVKKIYVNQKTSCKRRDHELPEYSLNEFIEWVFDIPDFHRLYDNWVISDYDMWLAPSFDREDDYKSYSFDNFRRFCTFRENNLRKAEDVRNGINNKINKPVIKIDGVKTTEYHSMRNAARMNKTYVAGISKCCLGKARTSGGFKWRYSND